MTIYTGEIEHPVLVEDDHQEYIVHISYTYSHAPMVWGQSMEDSVPDESELDYSVEDVYPTASLLIKNKILAILDEKEELIIDKCLEDALH